MERNRRRATSHRDGFSLLEVVIALGILGFGLLTLALMQMHALTQGSAGRHTGDAAAVARTYVEQVHRLPWAALTADVGSGWVAPSWNAAPAAITVNVTGPGGTSAENTYNVLWRVTNVAGTACLRDVEVRVSWAEEDLSSPKTLTLATRRYDWGSATC